MFIPIEVKDLETEKLEKLAQNSEFNVHLYLFKSMEWICNDEFSAKTKLIFHMILIFFKEGSVFSHQV